jgi:hypothetical protein
MSKLKWSVHGTLLMHVSIDDRHEHRQSERSLAVSNVPTCRKYMHYRAVPRKELGDLHAQVSKYRKNSDQQPSI